MGKRVFKVGDKVRVKASPHTLPDPNYVGTFDWEEPLAKIYTIRMVETSEARGFTSYRLEEVEARCWWWCGSWLLPANKIYLGGE